jgi:hypothetical protein
VSLFPKKKGIAQRRSGPGGDVCADASDECERFLRRGMCGTAEKGKSPAAGVEKKTGCNGREKKGEAKKKNEKEMPPTTATAATAPRSTPPAAPAKAPAKAAAAPSKSEAVAALKAEADAKEAAQKKLDADIAAFVRANTPSSSAPTTEEIFKAAAGLTTRRWREVAGAASAGKYYANGETVVFKAVAYAEPGSQDVEYDRDGAVMAFRAGTSRPMSPWPKTMYISGVVVSQKVGKRDIIYTVSVAFEDRPPSNANAIGVSDGVKVKDAVLMACAKVNRTAIILLASQGLAGSSVRVPWLTDNMVAEASATKGKGFTIDIPRSAIVTRNAGWDDMQTTGYYNAKRPPYYAATSAIPLDTPVIYRGKVYRVSRCAPPKCDLSRIITSPPDLSYFGAASVQNANISELVCVTGTPSFGEAVSLRAIPTAAFAVNASVSWTRSIGAQAFQRWQVGRVTAVTPNVYGPGLAQAVKTRLTTALADAEKKPASDASRYFSVDYETLWAIISDEQSRFENVYTITGGPSDGKVFVFEDRGGSNPVIKAPRFLAGDGTVVIGRDPLQSVDVADRYYQRYEFEIVWLDWVGDGEWRYHVRRRDNGARHSFRESEITQTYKLIRGVEPHRIGKVFGFMKELTATDRSNFGITNAEAKYIYITGQVGNIENEGGTYKYTLISFVDPMTGTTNQLTDHARLNKDIRQLTVLHTEWELETPTSMYGTLFKSDRITTVVPTVPLPLPAPKVYSMWDYLVMGQDKYYVDSVLVGRGNSLQRKATQATGAAAASAVAGLVLT